MYVGMRDENNGLIDLIADLPEMDSMLEVGSFAGESALMFYDSGKFKSITCVDVWQDKHAAERMAYAEKSFNERVGDKVIKIKSAFTESINLPKFDFIYIDADHNYESVKQDIILAKKLIKPNGIIAGHDYRETYQGVIKAVKEEFSEVKIYRDSSWRAL